MTAFRTKRSRSTAPLAMLLLVLQGLAGGLAPLAHASERLSAPAHIEAHHATACLVLHDALRCALCHYAGTRVLPQPARAQPATTTRTEPRPDCAELAPPRASDHLIAPPRAPPTPLV